MRREMRPLSGFAATAATIAALAASFPASAAEFYVNGASDTNPATGTQNAPFRTVQDAIDAAADGDEIRVAEGTYVENLLVQGKDLILRGGYSPTWTRDIDENVTTLEGAGGDSVVTLLECNSTVDGFRITGGEGSTQELPFARRGGGLYCRDGTFVIENNVIENNDIRSEVPPVDGNYGGGIYVTSSPSVTIRNNVIRENIAARGAGVSVECDELLAEGNTVAANVGVGDHGGGLYLACREGVVTGNTFRGNEIGRELGYGWGAGVILFNVGNSAEFSFNVYTGNFSAGFGAGIFVDEGAEATIHHELLYDNVAPDGCDSLSAIYVDGGEGGGSRVTIDHCTVVGTQCGVTSTGSGLAVEGDSTVAVANSIFRDNDGNDFVVIDTSTLTVDFTCSEESFGGEGNINDDPQFTDVDADDYTLRPGSPCIDAADPDAPFNREPAPNGGRADMGVFGNNSNAAPVGGDNDNDNGDNENDNGDDDNDNGDDNSNDNTDDGDPNEPTPPGGCATASILLMSMSIVGLVCTRRRGPGRARNSLSAR